MPTHRSAEKRVRSSENRRLRNRAARSDVKTQITRAEKLVVAGEVEGAKKAVVAAISALDRAAEKGILHPNNASRRKARLMKKLNQAQTNVKAEPEEAG